MGTFQRLEEIEAWKKARELTRDVYTISNHGPFAKDFPLRDQIRRASVSIMSNIAEGFERSGTAEFVQFLAMGAQHARWSPRSMWRQIKAISPKRKEITFWAWPARPVG